MVQDIKKFGQGNQNLINSLLSPNNIYVAFLCMFDKNLSNQLFPPSKQFFFASLIQICPVVQKIRSGNKILNIKKGHCDLKMMSRPPNSNKLFANS